MVSLKVTNLLGATVVTLENDFKQAGCYEVKLNRQNLTSGVYFYTLETATIRQTKKLSVK